MATDAKSAARSALSSVMGIRGQRDSHPGLLLQRYLEKWAAGDEGDPEEKRKILQAAINASKHKENLSLYKKAYERWASMLPPQTEVMTLETLGRIIVGLGSENVLEAGITLHHIYGMPWIPGSALKGLAAHFCSRVWGSVEPKFAKPSDSDNKQYRKWLQGEGEKPQENYHRLLFGTTDDGGCVIFHDGWFVPDSDPSPLRMDVMTPHHLEWLDGKVAPTDFDSPTPVPFLSVSGSFTFAVSWNSHATPESARWCGWAGCLLREALFQWGIGGKTSSGYGLFDEQKWQQQQAGQLKKIAEKQRTEEQAKARAAMHPTERKIVEFLENHPDKQGAKDYIKLINELKNPTGRFAVEEERRYVAQRVKEMMIAEKEWKDKGKLGERKKFIEGILEE
jgi:CRISPR type III-B/RAMP module RAMP protein Cmr6